MTWRCLGAEAVGETEVMGGMRWGRGGAESVAGWATRGKKIGRLGAPPYERGDLLEQHVLHRLAGGDHGENVLGVGHDDVEDVRTVVIEHLLDGFA